MFDTIRTMRLVQRLARPTAVRTAAAETTVAGFTPEQVLHLQRGTRAVLALGILASVGANVLHSITQPEAAAYPGWKLWTGAAFSALAPLVLFACIELVSRIPVHSRALGALRLVITFLVGGFAGWVSYWHMESVAEMLGEDGTAKYFYPLIIDGMMLVATISLIEVGRLARTVHTVVVQVEEAAEAAAAAAAAAAIPVPASRKPDKTELAARKKAKYNEMDSAQRAAWTKQYRQDVDAKAAKAARAATRGVNTLQDLLDRAGPLDDAPVSGAPAGV